MRSKPGFDLSKRTLADAIGSGRVVSIATTLRRGTVALALLGWAALGASAAEGGRESGAPASDAPGEAPAVCAPADASAVDASAGASAADASADASAADASAAGASDTSAVDASAAEADLPPASEGPHGAAPIGLQWEAGKVRGPLFPGVLGVEARAEAKPGLDFRLYWQDGINYRFANRFTLFEQSTHLDGRIGLRFQGDAAGYASDGIEDANGGVDLRRLYFITTGELDLVYPVLFALDLGFQRGGFFVDDAYLWVTGLPYVGTAKFGQFKAPMCLAQLTTSTTRPMMEIATPAEAFSPGSKAGIQLANDAYDERLTWQVGWFADTQAVPVGDASQSVSRMVGRLTGLAVDEKGESGPRLLHLSISSSFVFSNQQRVRYRSRPESFLAPEVVDTGDIEASSAVLLGLEGAWVNGPLSFQGEFLGSNVRASDEGNPLFWGLYGMASWFVTGETRPFNRTAAVFGPVVPKRSATWGDWQPGALELAGRLSWTDLSSGAVDGGEVFTMMSGINWYWNRYVRWMFEYGYSHVAGGPQSGRLHIFQARLQINI